MAEGSCIIPQRIARGSQHLHHLHKHLQQGDTSGHVQLWEALGHLQAQTPGSYSDPCHNAPIHLVANQAQPLLTSRIFRTMIEETPMDKLLDIKKHSRGWVEQYLYEPLVARSESLSQLDNST